MHSRANWLCPALCCAMLCAPGARSEDQKPGGLDLDDLGALPVKKKAPPPKAPKAPKAPKSPQATKGHKAPWLTGTQPSAVPAEAQSKLVAPPGTTPVEAPAPAKAMGFEARPRTTTSGAAASTPPLLKLATQYGILMPRGELVDELTSADVESGLKTIAFQAPMSARPTVLRDKAVPCKPEDDGCFAALGLAAGVDEVIVASLSRANNALELKVRRVDVAFRKSMAAAAQGGLSTKRLELKAWGEALLCRLIMPVGCGGELLVDTAGAELQIAGNTLPRSGETPQRIKLPVGVHAIRAVRNGKPGPERLISVLRESSTQLTLAVRESPDGPRLATPQDPDFHSAPEAAVADAASAGSGRKWTKPTGYTVAAVGAVALAVGVVQGLRSKSMIQNAEASYQANQGAYRPANLSELASGNSTAKNANLLFAVGGVLATAGLVVAFAF